MKPLRIVSALFLVVLLLIPVFAVDDDGDGGEAASDISVSETTDDVITEEPPETETADDILEYVVSINTYLTYLFGFTVVAFAWWCCSLVYKFLNMFF